MLSLNVSFVEHWEFLQMKICAIFLQMSVWYSHQTFLAGGRADRARIGNNKIWSQIPEYQNSKCQNLNISNAKDLIFLQFNIFQNCNSPILSELCLWDGKKVGWPADRSDSISLDPKWAHAGQCWASRGLQTHAVRDMGGGQMLWGKSHNCLQQINIYNSTCC